MSFLEDNEKSTIHLNEQYKKGLPYDRLNKLLNYINTLSKTHFMVHITQQLNTQLQLTMFLIFVITFLHD